LRIKSKTTSSQKSEPERLYKFASVSGISRTNAVEILLANRIYFPSPGMFNDPFDSLPNFKIGSGKKGRELLYKRIVTGEFPDEQDQRHIDRFDEFCKKDPLTDDNEKKVFFEDLTNQLTRKKGVLCLSGRYDDPLLWAHYADCHKGIAWIFKKNSNFFRKARPVQYTEHRPAINLSIANQSAHILGALLTKADCWEHEEEWRLIGSQVGYLGFEPHALAGMILGAKMSKEDRDYFIQHALSRRTNSPQLEISQAILDEVDYRIKTIRLDLPLAPAFTE
jgi:hypothetical protein